MTLLSVVVLDPRADAGPGRGLGGEMLHPPQLKLHGRVPGLDNGAIQAGARPAHGLPDAQPGAGRPERARDVLPWLYLMRDTPAMLRELNAVERRYRTVLQVLGGIPVTEV